jgi:hypothetical protein
VISIEDGITCLVDGSAKMSDDYHLTRISVADLQNCATRCVSEIKKKVVTYIPLQQATIYSCLFCHVRLIICSNLRTPEYVTELSAWSSPSVWFSGWN